VEEVSRTENYKVTGQKDDPKKITDRWQKEGPENNRKEASSVKEKRILDLKPRLLRRNAPCDWTGARRSRSFRQHGLGLGEARKGKRTTSRRSELLRGHGGALAGIWPVPGRRLWIALCKPAGVGGFASKWEGQDRGGEDGAGDVDEGGNTSISSARSRTRLYLDRGTLFHISILALRRQPEQEQDHFLGVKTESREIGLDMGLRNPSDGRPEMRCHWLSSISSFTRTSQPIPRSWIARSLVAKTCEDVGGCHKW
jgi:hypothetical protein